MLINSDWHCHSENSYDAKNPISQIAEGAMAQGLRAVGITDHANFNDEKFLGDLQSSCNGVKAAQEKYPFLVLGVELTPIERPEFDYIAVHKTREGYIPPVLSAPYELELAQTKEELIARGVRYAVGGAHWRVDVPYARQLPADLDACIREWYRQQMWLACDERVTILAHPWCNGSKLWYNDFSVIPCSMNEDLAAALKENGKYAECNSALFSVDNTSERFRCQYAEFLRELFEKGIPITYGSDSHLNYLDRRPGVEKYLRSVGFKDGDISDLSEGDFWR